MVQPEEADDVTCPVSGEVKRQLASQKPLLAENRRPSGVVAGKWEQEGQRDASIAKVAQWAAASRLPGQLAKRRKAGVETISLRSPFGAFGRRFGCATFDLNPVRF